MPSTIITPTNLYERRSEVYHHEKWISSFTPRGHLNGAMMTAQEEIYFGQKWPFKHHAAMKHFVDMNLARWTWQHVPDGLDDRIPVMSRVLSCLFLFDDVFDGITLEEGSRQVETVLDIITAGTEPEPANHVGIILQECFKEMTAIDPMKVKPIEVELAVFLRASVDTKRGQMKNLKEYLIFRDADAGLTLSRFLSAFAMDINLTDAERTLVYELELIASFNISLVNDLFSWEKEQLMLQFSEPGTAVDVNSIGIVMRQFDMSVEQAKLYLANEVASLELEFLAIVAGMKDDISDELRRYITYLRDSCAGNESWSMVTARYNVVGGRCIKPVIDNPGFRKPLDT